MSAVWACNYSHHVMLQRMCYQMTIGKPENRELEQEYRDLRNSPKKLCLKANMASWSASQWYEWQVERIHCNKRCSLSFHRSTCCRTLSMMERLPFSWLKRKRYLLSQTTWPLLEFTVNLEMYRSETGGKPLSPVTSCVGREVAPNICKPCLRRSSA